MLKKYHYLYKITNNCNGKIYIGVHATDNMDDGYMGSGHALQFAIKKYGVKNFNKEILQTFDSTEAMYEAESVIVNEEFVANNKTYNLVTGGKCRLERHSETTKAKMRKSQANFSPERRHNMSVGIKLNRDNYGSWWTGRRHSEESKAKIGQANAKAQTGSGNSNYGKRWISNNAQQISKSILKTEEIPEGWVLGRNNWKKLATEKNAKIVRITMQNAKTSSLTEADMLYTTFIERGFSSIADFVRSSFNTKRYTYSKISRLFADAAKRV